MEKSGNYQNFLYIRYLQNFRKISTALFQRHIRHLDIFSIFSYSSYSLVKVVQRPPFSITYNAIFIAGPFDIFVDKFPLENVISSGCECVSTSTLSMQKAISGAECAPREHLVGRLSRLHENSDRISVQRDRVPHQSPSDAVACRATRLHHLQTRLLSGASHSRYSVRHHH